MAMRRLPLAFSCDRPWSEMQGSSSVRSCDDCGCKVLNLSSLDEESAKELLARRQGRVCVRFRSRKGKVVFSKVRRAVAVAAAALLIASPAAADTTPPPAPEKRSKSSEHKTKKLPNKKREIIDTVGWLG
jgi:hypothetical protein